MNLEVFDELTITPIDKTNEEIALKSFRVSCTSDSCRRDEFDLNLIGVLFIKCPNEAKTVHGRSLLPGYIHLKLIKNLKKPEELGDKSYHEQCFEAICNENLENYLVLGFGLYYNGGEISYGQAKEYGMLNLESDTFNTRLNKYLGLNPDSDPNYKNKTAEIFTPILQAVMRKYKLEFCVGFTLNIEHIPVKVYSNFCQVYKNLIQYKTKKVEFATNEDFYQWCRKYFVSEQNEKKEFEYWFKEGKQYGMDMDYFHNFIVC